MISNPRSDIAVNVDFTEALRDIGMMGGLAGSAVPLESMKVD